MMDLGTYLAGQAVDIVIDLATGRIPVDDARRRAQLWMNAAAEVTSNPRPFPEVTS